MVELLDMMQLCTKDRYSPKPPNVQHLSDSIAREYNLVTMEGLMWMQWRGNFTSGFIAGHIMKAIPGTVVEAVYSTWFTSRAGGKKELVSRRHW